MRSCPYSFRGCRPRQCKRWQPRMKNPAMMSRRPTPPSHNFAAEKNGLELQIKKPLTKRTRPIQTRALETGSGSFGSTGSRGGQATMRASRPKSSRLKLILKSGGVGSIAWLGQRREHGSHAFQASRHISGYQRPSSISIMSKSVSTVPSPGNPCFLIIAGM